MPSTVIDRHSVAQITALPGCEITAIVNAICYSSGYFDPPPAPTLASQHKDQASRLLEDMMRISSQDPGQSTDALQITADDVKLLIACLDDAWLNLNAVNLDIWIGLPLSEIRNVCAKLRKLIGFEPWNISDLLDQVPVTETVWPRGRSLTVANQLVTNLPGSTLAWEPDDDWNWACIYSAHVMVGMVWLNGPLALASPGIVPDVLKLDDQYVSSTSMICRHQCCLPLINQFTACFQH